MNIEIEFKNWDGEGYSLVGQRSGFLGIRALYLRLQDVTYTSINFYYDRLVGLGVSVSDF